LVDNGIPLENVVYICYGIEICRGGNGWGTIDNFTIFSAVQLNVFIQQNSGKELSRSNANDVHGFCTTMLHGN
jgi:hypothetical protein